MTLSRSWILLGAALIYWICGLQRLLADPSFWLDEAFVAQSFLHRHAWELFGPLEYGQVFPRFYLVWTGLLRDWLGYKTLVLRLIPYLAFCAGTVLWARFLIVRTRSLWDTLLAAALLLASTVWLFHSSNFKQYSGDGLFCILPFLISDEKIEAFFGGRRKTHRVVLYLLAPILLSYPYPLALGARLLGWFLRRSQGFREISRVRLGEFFLISIGTGALFYFFDRRYFPEASLVDYWKNLILGENLHSARDLLRILAGFFLGWFRWDFPRALQIVLGVLTLVGLARLLREPKRHPLLLDSALLIALMIGASLVLHFPLGPERVCIFALVHLHAFSISGFQTLSQAASRFKMTRWALVLFTAVVLAYSLRAANSSRRERVWQNIRPLVKKMDPSVTDILLVPAAATPHVQTLPEGIPLKHVLYKIPSAPFGQAYLIEITGTSPRPEPFLATLREAGAELHVVASAPFSKLYLVDFRKPRERSR